MVWAAAGPTRHAARAVPRRTDRGDDPAPAPALPRRSGAPSAGSVSRARGSGNALALGLRRSGCDGVRSSMSISSRLASRFGRSAVAAPSRTSVAQPLLSVRPALAGLSKNYGQTDVTLGVPSLAKP